LLTAVAAVLAITAWWVVYAIVTVPIHRPPLTAAGYSRALPVAAVSALLVLVVDLLVVPALHRGHRNPAPSNLSDGGVAAAWRLSVGRVPARAMAVTVVACSVLLAEALLLDFPLWTVVLVLLIPWIPLYLSDTAWRFERFGAYALFGTLVVLQVGHLGEHIVQNIQLLLTHDIRQSRGVFGQLDVETVHVIWNLIAWLGSAYLLWALGTRNGWLWLAFAVASFHTVEHFYLFWLYAADRPLYLSGGWNGIFAQGGLFPTALARPYLHLVYNVLEVTPFAAAFWWQLNADAHTVRPAKSVQEDRVIAPV
jgi:hypothetical protein